ncbi:MAG: PhoH family protein [Bacteroidia bacterium]|nr:PhoH family protein [Bacteroidia bacterium]
MKKIAPVRAEHTHRRKIYVLDTSVILHDSHAIDHFQDNDVAIPITVLEELDNFKQGSALKNFEARSFIRFLDQLAGTHTLQDWIPIEGENRGRFRVVMPRHPVAFQDAEVVFDDRKPDHKILNAALALQEDEPEARVILVTKDINLRLKAKALNLPAEDYETGKIKDLDNLYTGKALIEGIEHEIINEMFEKGAVGIEQLMPQFPPDNHYYILKNGTHSTLAFYNPVNRLMERVEKQSAFGIKPKNAEQAFALHAIFNPEVKLVTIRGGAGTGKTLIALAGALEQRRDFRQILIARPVVPLSNKDIGFLPGDVKDKLNPYMEPLWDNLKFIKNQFSATDKAYKLIEEMVEQEKIMITPLAYIRGRSLSKVMFIIDEAQNLTPHEIKTIITRAGENTKLIFTGDIDQIDTPYLDSQSNGLSYVIDKLKGNRLYAHVTLEKGERSELANLASELL